MVSSIFCAPLRALKVVLTNAAGACAGSCDDLFGLARTLRSEDDLADRLASRECIERLSDLLERQGE